MKRALLFCFFCATTLISQAQVKYILEGGYALTANFSPSLALREPINGIQIDAAVDYRFKAYPFLGIKGGLGYKLVGYYSDTRRLMSPTDNRNTVSEEYIIDHSVFLPARLTVNFDVNNWTLRALTGPKLSYHFGEMYYNTKSTEENNYSFIWIKSSLGYVYVPFDCSWSVGFGCAYNHLYLETGLDLGLFNRTRRDHASYRVNSLSSREFYLTIGYIF